MKRLLAITLAASLLATACGDDDVASTLASTTSTTTTATTAPAPTTTTSTTTTTTLPPTTTTTTLTPGTQEIRACQIREEHFGGIGVGVGFPRMGWRLQPTGMIQVAVLFTDFDDAVANRTPEEAFALIDGTVEFFETVSYGRLQVEFIPHLEWLRVAEPAAFYADAITGYHGHKEWIEEAVTLADAAYDFSEIDEIVVIATPEAEIIGYGPTWTGGQFADGWIDADGARITNGVTSGLDILYWGFLWLPHEMGHSLSFVDMYDYDGGPGFTGEFSLMNDIAAEAPEYLAWERWHAGWLDDDQIVCLADDATVTLEPVELPGGTKAAVVPIGTTRAVVIESRRAIGYDSALQREGAIVYVVDTTVYSGYGTVEVMNGQQALREGESVTVDGVTVTVVSADESSDTIEIVVE